MQYILEQCYFLSIADDNKGLVSMLVGRIGGGRSFWPDVRAFCVGDSRPRGCAPKRPPLLPTAMPAAAAELLLVVVDVDAELFLFFSVWYTLQE